MMEFNEILNQLSTFGHDQPLPREALVEAALQKEAITPILLEALDTIYEKVQSEGEGVYDDPAYDLSGYAVFLLAQFQEQRAFPKLLRMLTLDKDSLDIVLDDLTEYMGNVLYSTYNGGISAAKAIIADSSLDPFAREAPLKLLEGLLRDGRLPRTEMVDFLRECLASLGHSEDEEIFGGMLVSLIAYNDLYELAEDVREAFRLEKIDTMYLGDFEDFFDYLYNKTEHYDHARLITDTVQELNGWACFRDETSKPSISDILSWKVGRNDPCPCGSGKKFKKCCLPKKEEWLLRFNSDSTWEETDRDKYPPVGRTGNRPGLSDFYSEDALAVDRLAYQALLMLKHPTAQQKKKARRSLFEAQELLWNAFEKFRQICEAKGLKTAEEYDQEHKVHYYCKHWIEILRDLLKDAEDDRYLAVQAML